MIFWKGKFKLNLIFVYLNQIFFLNVISCWKFISNNLSIGFNLSVKSFFNYNQSLNEMLKSKWIIKKCMKNLLIKKDQLNFSYDSMTMEIDIPENFHCQSFSKSQIHSQIVYRKNLLDNKYYYGQKFDAGSQLFHRSIINIPFEKMFGK